MDKKIFVKLKWFTDTEGLDNDDGEQEQFFILEKGPSHKDYPNYHILIFYRIHSIDQKILCIPINPKITLEKKEQKVLVFFRDVDPFFGPQPLVSRVIESAYVRHLEFEGYNLSYIREFFKF